jgi:hypothetical protein
VQCGIQRIVSPLSFLSWDTDASPKSAPEHTRGRCVAFYDRPMSVDKDFKKQEKSIESVFPKDLDDISKQTETIEIYKANLEINLTFKVKLTGIEDFD